MRQLSWKAWKKRTIGGDTPSNRTYRACAGPGGTLRPRLQVIAFILLAAIHITGSQALSSRLYSWVDERGVWHFTNVAPPPGASYGSTRSRDLGFSEPRRSAYDAALSRIHIGGLYDASINEAALAYGLDPDLIRAVIRAESGGNPRAVSSRGAQGLMQLMPATARELAVYDPFDPDENIWAGTRYLKAMLRRFDGDILLALAAYNAGPGAVERHGGIPPYDETIHYVQRVLRFWREFKQDRAAY